jgi:hypothetical protein
MFQIFTRGRLSRNTKSVLRKLVQLGIDGNALTIQSPGSKRPLEMVTSSSFRIHEMKLSWKEINNILNETLCISHRMMLNC